ncbi:hypothetical protein MMC12_001251 [Toensbergia leucococca]|nr:hypothetical protein [Toensbergia leucococca]
MVLSAVEIAVRDLVTFARTNSPFYRRHYENVPENVNDLAQIPIVDHTSFWAANTNSPSQNQVITSSFVDGAIFRTGGTTGIPKASYSTREEVRQGAQNMAMCLVRAGLLPGDRVANLLYGGDLYKGFVELSLALMEVTVPNVHLSIGVAPLESQVWTLREYSPTMLVAMPTIMCRLGEYLIKQNEPMASVRVLLFVGELLHKEQKAMLRKAFPSARIGPLCYVSVDGGIMGLPATPPDDGDESTAMYTVNRPSMIIELVTDTDQPITKEGERGSVVLTDLFRRLTPVIRYPMGDVAEWIDYDSRTFRLWGRGNVGVRVGPNSYDMTNLRTVVTNVLKSDAIHGFQVVLRRANSKDEMVFRIASHPQNPEQMSKEVKEEMDKVNQEWAEEVRDGFINPLVIEWVSVHDLLYNARSGKLREVVDLRTEASSVSSASDKAKL